MTRDIATEKLIEAAAHAALNSYTPYSHFPVGAAVRTDSGIIIPGCNVENDSYGLTICAERCAMFAAVAQGFHTLVALAVTCPKGDPSSPESLMPCGACRQVMTRLLTRDAVITVVGVGPFTIDQLIPCPYRLSPPQ